MIINDELKRLWNYAVLSCFNIIISEITWRSYERPQKPQDILPLIPNSKPLRSE